MELLIIIIWFICSHQISEGKSTIESTCIEQSACIGYRINHESESCIYIDKTQPECKHWTHSHIDKYHAFNIDMTQNMHCEWTNNQVCCKLKFDGKQVVRFNLNTNHICIHSSDVTKYHIVDINHNIDPNIHFECVENTKNLCDWQTIFSLSKFVSRQSLVTNNRRLLFTAVPANIEVVNCPDPSPPPTPIPPGGSQKQCTCPPTPAPTPQKACQLQCDATHMPFESECQDTKFVCQPNVDCRIECDGDGVCSSSGEDDATNTISKTQIDCTGAECCDIQCSGEDTCKNADIISGNGNFTVNCNGKAACQDQTICGENSLYMDVNCIGENSCKGNFPNSAIPKDGLIKGGCYFNIECHGIASCQQVHFDGTNSWSVNVICDAENACMNSNNLLTCGSGGPCALECNNNNDACKDMIINLNGAASWSCTESGTDGMACSRLGNGIGCEIPGSPTTPCPTTLPSPGPIPGNQPTPPPTGCIPTTDNPTISPTNNPTTNNPTTFNPTTFNPTTFNPTTFNPTTNNP
eukprot:398259_1